MALDEARQAFLYADDGDAFMAADRQQMLVPSDDRVHLANHRRGDDVIVVGIAGHHTWNFRGLDQRDDALVPPHQGGGIRSQERQSLGELRVAQGMTEFRQPNRAAEELDAILQRLLQQAPGRAAPSVGVALAMAGRHAAHGVDHLLFGFRRALFGREPIVHRAQALEGLAAQLRTQQGLHLLFLIESQEPMGKDFTEAQAPS